MMDDTESNCDDVKRMLLYPLLVKTDMPDEGRVETQELCVSACEKYPANNESAARMIKDRMDKKTGETWHVLVGECFGFEISYDTQSLLYMFFGGNVAVLLWKCS